MVLLWLISYNEDRECVVESWCTIKHINFFNIKKNVDVADDVAQHIYASFLF